MNLLLATLLIPIILIIFAVVAHLIREFLRQSRMY